MHFADACRAQAELLCRRAALQVENEQALADLSAALRVDPDNVDALLLRAGVYDTMGDKERSFLDLRRIRIVAPQVCELTQLD